MEQSLVEDLMIESISIYGHQVYYCPRTLVAKDDIYGEDTISEYNNAYLIDMYIRSFDSYEGDGTFLSKFNLEIRDQMTFTVARRTFYNEISTQEFIDRPQEGDLGGFDCGCCFHMLFTPLFLVPFLAGCCCEREELGFLRQTLVVSLLLNGKAELAVLEGGIVLTKILRKVDHQFFVCVVPAENLGDADVVLSCEHGCCFSFFILTPLRTIS